MDLREAYDITSHLAHKDGKVTLQEARTLLTSKKVRSQPSANWIIKALETIIQSYEMPTHSLDQQDLPIEEQMLLLLEDIVENVRILSDMIKKKGG